MLLFSFISSTILIKLFSVILLNIFELFKSNLEYDDIFISLFIKFSF